MFRRFGHCATPIGLNPRDYNEALRQLELEVLKLKDIYDKELNKLR